MMVLEEAGGQGAGSRGKDPIRSYSPCHPGFKPTSATLSASPKFIYAQKGDSGIPSDRLQKTSPEQS
ncbi:MAG: hypothetical protein RMZ43_001915 [Nostoc sp. CmiVER01]|uniref:hypothetical protein n=1 Tax=Nostoc sp. CmiVER01 TaxID=3075384 RepID=UPI002AD33401|nr:hypothetical protein [Nostoc sp. CmiVER01]MDZ8122459.1 hypothetical protein [Nostoc sp. CmiVER01]